MKKADNRKFAIYSRKSKFTGKGESIENQIELCRQHIHLHNSNVKDEDILVFEDEGFSGGNTNRPQFKEMLKAIKENQIRAVVCYRLDRISRNVGDFARLKDDLDDKNVDFVSVRDNFDTTTPAGRAMMMMVSVFAQLERETTAERIRDNMHELAKSGRWLGGTTPTGYKSTRIVSGVTVDGKKRSAYKLDIVKEEAETVKMIFDKFIETNSLTMTDKYLFQNCIKTKNGKNYQRYAIRAILTNPVYMKNDKDAWNYFNDADIELFSDESEFDGKHGIMAYNKTIQKPGKSNKTRDMDEWIIAVGKHKGLIDGDDWVKVQKMLSQNSSKSFHKPRSNVALLSGLLFCGNCGDFMRPKLSSRLNANGERIYTYLCETKERSCSQRCKSKNPNGNELDKAVCEQIKMLSDDNSDFMKGLKNARKNLKLNREEYEKKLGALSKEYAENEKKIYSLVDVLSKGEGQQTVDYITSQMNALHEENQKIKSKIEELNQLLNNKICSDDEFEILRDTIKNFGKLFDSMSVEQKRSAFRTFVKKIIWDGEYVRVFLVGDTKAEIDLSNSEPLYGDSERNFYAFSITKKDGAGCFNERTY